MVEVRLSPQLRLTVPLVFVLLSALAACGGSNSGSGAYGEADAVAVEENSVTVEMRDINFKPQGIRIRPGTTVTWVNEDTVVHNVRQVESKFLSPDEMGSGATFTFKFTEPGKYRYECTFHHPNMNGVVVVEAE